MAVNQTEAMPPQLRAARVRKQRVIKAIILTFTLLFLFVPLVSMFVFTIRHPLSGKWSLDPWIAIFTGDGSALGADLSTLWSVFGFGSRTAAVFTAGNGAAEQIYCGEGNWFRWIWKHIHWLERDAFMQSGN